MSDERQDAPSESSESRSDASADAAENATEDAADNANTDAVSRIEQALVAIRRDQARRRLQRRAEHERRARLDEHEGGDPGPRRPWPRHEGEPGGQGRGWPHHGGPHGSHPHHPHHDGSLGQAARFRLLDAIDAAPGGVSIGTLADRIGVDQPRASRLVGEATERGHVRRTPDPADGRRSVVTLTDAGRAILREAHRGRRDAVTSALDGFTAEETELLAELLSRFVAAWPRDEG